MNFLTENVELFPELIERGLLNFTIENIQEIRKHHLADVEYDTKMKYYTKVLLRDRPNEYFYEIGHGLTLNEDLVLLLKDNDKLLNLYFDATTNFRYPIPKKNLIIYTSKEEDDYYFEYQRKKDIVKKYFYYLFFMYLQIKEKLTAKLNKKIADYLQAYFPSIEVAAFEDILIDATFFIMGSFPFEQFLLENDTRDYFKDLLTKYDEEFTDHFQRLLGAFVYLYKKNISDNHGKYDRRILDRHHSRLFKEEGINFRRILKFRPEEIDRINNFFRQYLPIGILPPNERDELMELKFGKEYYTPTNEEVLYYMNQPTNPSKIPIEIIEIAINNKRPIEAMEISDDENFKKSPFHKSSNEIIDILDSDSEDEFLKHSPFFKKTKSDNINPNNYSI